MCRHHTDDHGSEEPEKRNGGKLEKPTAAHDDQMEKASDVKDSLAAIHQLSHQIVASAWDGQRLPQLTLVWLSVAMYQAFAFLAKVEARPNHATMRLSTSILLLATILLISGYALLVVLYRHSIQTIFNRNLPVTVLKSLPSFAAHLALLKPLEIMYRRITAQIRVLPDILVLGEVRCGTTTICQHLSALPGAHAPFCLWKHPELDRKETFYFVGHYLGNVHPSGYRMCFPLQLTKWIHTYWLGRPFFTFDGCAQYLTSPTAPYLIAKAYQDAGQPPPILVACVRDPVDQATSWWRYEHNAMAWGDSMGLTEWNTTLRGEQPMTVNDALDRSMSDTMQELYDKAEGLFPLNSAATSDYVLPPWAMTWPGGQLTGVGRNGAFWTNIQRYETVFEEVFGKKEGARMVPASSRLSHVNVIPLDFLKDDTKLSSTLSSLMQQLDARQPSGSTPTTLGVSSHVRLGLHRNALVKLLGKEAIRAEEFRLARLFSKDTAELETKCGIQFGWKVC